MLRNLCIGLIMAAFAVASAGCNSGPGAKRKDLPRQYPAVIEDWSGSTIDRVEFAKPFSLNDYHTLSVEPFDTSKVEMPTDNTREPVKRAVRLFDERFAEGLRDTLEGVVAVKLRSDATSPPPGTLVLRGTVAEINPGSRAVRFWVGYGAGRSLTEIDGELVDPRTGQILARFKHAKASGLGLFGGDYDKFLRDDALDVGRDVGTLVGAFYVAPHKKK